MISLPPPVPPLNPPIRRLLGGSGGLKKTVVFLMLVK